MTKAQLFDQIKLKRSFLCIGLDPVLENLPEHLLDDEDPIFSFNKAIIDATEDLCVAYKPNTAFYEMYGTKGWNSLQKTWSYFSKDLFTIADAKRGDIGNTSKMYAAAFFNEERSGMGFDAVTVAPYMGSDSVVPFLNHEHKWVILLALTSNAGSTDFQSLHVGGKNRLYEEVIARSSKWGNSEQIMYVVGATKADAFESLRALAPDSFFLVPGIGAQGGSLAEVCRFGLNKTCGLLVNSARQIIYAGKGTDFAEMARAEALKVQQEMEVILHQHDLI
ncbi:orotidine-5'-phosphate decarboxylase [Pedobacter yulinensis]|uniref:Orotidine-5'-phosphate decarboxylase n=1 Tax=Pedobacter yulinensis TaxID=2126353 RepID=A0A2T3HN31_9SPHI|nr:orotidine-5'-phosphate decarboxylase [Pedobacter yulinensis]PST83854.1 orotidine-5'-phosphate decarboxylase [Pedobacter yulinensis]